MKIKISRFNIKSSRESAHKIIGIISRNAQVVFQNVEWI